MIRDTLRIKAEIIAEHFDPMTLKEMSGWEFLPEVARIKEQEAEGQQMMQQYQMQHGTNGARNKQGHATAAGDATAAADSPTRHV